MPRRPCSGLEAPALNQLESEAVGPSGPRASWPLPGERPPVPDRCAQERRREGRNAMWQAHSGRRWHRLRVGGEGGYAYAGV